MKPLYILSLVAVVASIVLGVMNRMNFVNARKEKDQANREIVKNFKSTDDEIAQINDLIQKWQERGRAKEADEYATQTENKTKATHVENDKTVVKQTQDFEAAIQSVKDEMKAILGDFGSPEELASKRDLLKKEVEDQENAIIALDKEIGGLNTEVGENEKVIGRFRDNQTQFDKTISLGTREGTITAVNPDWAFVVVNMGKSQGVNSDSRLLVKRGDTLIGRLKIAQIENNVTIADIDSKSTKGQPVLPGDQVIFDNAAN
jgi:hypothetical protein